MAPAGEFDFDRGLWARPSEDPGMKLCIAGDWAPVRAFARILENDPEKIYGDLLPGIRSADLSVVNLNAPLSASGQAAIKSGPVFKGKKKHAQALKAVPFTAATLASGHVIDYGPRASDFTIRFPFFSAWGTLFFSSPRI